MHDEVLILAAACIGLPALWLILAWMERDMKRDKWRRLPPGWGR